MWRGKIGGSRFQNGGAHRMDGGGEHSGARPKGFPSDRAEPNVRCAEDVMESERFAGGRMEPVVTHQEDEHRFHADGTNAVLQQLQRGLAAAGEDEVEIRAS